MQALAEMKKKKPDTEKAFQLLQSAHKKGDAHASYALATWYYHGAYVEKNLKKAVSLAKAAVAKENIAEAFFNLAVSYERGEGIVKNESKAYELYLKAAIWGDEQAFYEVGRCLFHGIGTSQNKRLARVWLERARTGKGENYTNKNPR